MLSFFVLPTQKERFYERYLHCTRTRTIFTPAQVIELEANFKRRKYLGTAERFEVAERLGLNPVTVKTWFQNRRMRWKKDMRKKDPLFKPTRAKGRPPKSDSCADLEEESLIVD